ncbi:MAG: DUF2971 domain-containing protein [Bacilli bacterium]
MRYIKYLSEKSAELFIKDLTLRYTPLNDFNDPFEGNIIVGLLDDTVIEEYTVSIDLSNHNVIYDKYLVTIDKIKSKSNIKDILHKLCDIQGIACLCLSACEIATNPLMWAHYSKDHKGIAITFDPNHPYFKEVDKVYYTQDRAVLNEKIFIENKNGLPINTFFAKDKCWSYENEVRLTKLQSKLICSKNGNNDNILKDSIPIEAIKEILIGCRATKSFKEKISSFCKNHSINCFSLKTNDDSYSLTIDTSEKPISSTISWELMTEMLKY